MTICEHCGARTDETLLVCSECRKPLIFLAKSAQGFYGYISAIQIKREINVKVCAHCGCDDNRLANLFCIDCGQSLSVCTHCNCGCNRTSNLFCVECGKALSTCPLCGQINRLGNSSCAHCGQIISKDKITTKTTTEWIECAGFWRRLVAYILDWIILGFIEAPLSFAAFFLPYAYYYHFGPIANIIYTIGFWSRKSRTPGKMALNVMIVTEEGEPISTGRAFIRYFGYIVSSIPFGLGFFWIAWDSKKQGWHDKLANTYVIKV